MTPAKSDPFCGLYFVSEKNFGDIRGMILRDLDGNFYRRTFINGRWSEPRPTQDQDERGKLSRLYRDVMWGIR